MIARYRSLAQRIRTELVDLDRTQDTALRHWQRFRTAASDQDAFLNSVAFALHSLYTDLERLFELVATELDGGALGRDSWHTELLRQMALDLPEIRPPVIQADTARRLDEYRKFRHLVRNVYASNLDAARVERLVDDLPETWGQVRRDLADFSQFLDQLTHADSARD